MRKYTVYLLFINILILALLMWIGDARYRDFRAYHISIAQESTSSAAQAISSFITEKKRLVALFARDYQDLIGRFMLNPDDDSLHQQLSETIAIYFPHFFTFTVADADGVPLKEDFEGYVGDLCTEDLKKFIGQGKQLPRIHPNYEVYHFDILAPLPAALQSGTLLISFHADILGSVLNSAQTPGHQLMLIDPSINLIEVTADGARINWPRDDYRLSAQEQSRVLFANKVANTVWDAVDLNLPGLFSQYRSTLILNSALLFILFFVASIIMYVIVRREERLRIRAEQNKDEFLALVTHELRTPITAIRGSMELINNGYAGETSEGMNEYLGIAINNCKRMSLLIDDLLDLQKIEAGKLDFDMQAQKLEQLVAACIENNRGYSERFNATISFNNHAGDVEVNVDAARFEQALANLLSNAVKYGAQQDNIVVTLDRLQEYARISVTDHGRGIPASALHHVFRRFTQLGNTSSADVKGTGLGLSIVKSLIENQGGQVGFNTEEGQGSTFYILLPVV